jgi:hypothetical protein
MITRVPAPRKWSAERNSANQLRLTGSGRNERTSRTHSARAPGGAARAGTDGAGGWILGWAAAAWVSNSKPGMAGSSRSQGVPADGGTRIGWLTVGVYRNWADSPGKPGRGPRGPVPPWSAGGRLGERRPSNS